MLLIAGLNHPRNGHRAESGQRLIGRGVASCGNYGRAVRGKIGPLFITAYRLRWLQWLPGYHAKHHIDIINNYQVTIVRRPAHVVTIEGYTKEDEWRYRRTARTFRIR